MDQKEEKEYEMAKEGVQHGNEKEKVKEKEEEGGGVGGDEDF